MNCKKMLFLLLISVVLVLIVPSLAFASNGAGDFGDEPDYYHPELYEYTISGGNATITKYLGNSSSLYYGGLSIPNELDGHPVTEIGRSTFSNMDFIQYVEFPAYLEKIGDSAFWDCDGLEYIDIPAGVLSIDDSAFEECSMLQEVSIPYTVQSIGSEAFSGYYSNLEAFYVDGESKYFESVNGVLYNKAMTTLVSYPSAKPGSSFTIPTGVSEIGPGAFSCCRQNLKNITIPNTVKTIREEAFSDCDLLTSLVIPNSVTNIEGGAIIWCDNLKKITVASGNKSFVSKADVLYNKSMTTLIAFPAKKSSGSFTVPNGIKKIASGAFSSSKLSGIVLPDSVTSIGSWAFSYCKNLKKITIPYQVKSISANSFYECSNVTISGYTGSVAQTYAKKNKIPFKSIGSMPVSISKITSSTESGKVGSPITWTAAAKDGSGKKTYRFLLYKDGKQIESGKFSSSKTYKYTPIEPGKYKVKVYVKDNTGTAVKTSAEVTVKAPLAITGIKADKTSAETGMAITWTVAAKGGSGTKTYRFLLYKDGKQIESGKFGSSKTFRYTPTAPGKYKVKVYVKDGTGTVSKTSGIVAVSK
jgi:hypothetical protein